MRFIYYYTFSFFFLLYILKDTLLCDAARNGHTDIVRLLIENGANVNEGDWVRLKDKLYTAISIYAVGSKPQAYKIRPKGNMGS